MLSIRNFISNIKIFISLLCLSFVFSSSSQAQQEDFSWRISAGYGYTNYYGDLSNYNISWKNADNIFKLFHFNLKNSYGSSHSSSMLNSYSVSIERKWTNTFGIIAQYSNNIIYGNDRTNLNGSLHPSNQSFSRALNFKSVLNDLSLGVVIKADNDIILRSTSFIAPYLTLTAGYTFFDTKADLYDADGDPYNYLTDGTIALGISPDGVYETSLSSLKTGGKKYDSNAFNVGLGLGLRFRITSRFGIHAESALRYTFTDLLDDVSGNYPTVYQSTEQKYASNPTGVVRARRGNPNTRDMFVYNSISLRFSFGVPKKTLYRAPVFNPNSFLVSKEQPSTKTIIDTLVLVSDNNQAFSTQPDTESTISDIVSDKREKLQFPSTEGNHYEIQVLKKDSTKSRTNIRIENGMINEISIENSDAIITGYFVQNPKLSILDNDSLKFSPSVTTIFPENTLSNGYQHKIHDMETKASIRSDSMSIQSDRDKYQKELLERQWEQFSQLKGLDVDSINKPGLKEGNYGDIESFNKLKEELNQKIEANAGKYQAIQKDNQNLNTQLDSQNKMFNERLLQLQQQIKHNEIETDQKTQNYQEPQHKIQEVNTMTISDPELDPELKKEFEKLSLQIKQYEEDRLILTKTDSSMAVKDIETIQPKDSLTIQLKDSLTIQPKDSLTSQLKDSLTIQLKDSLMRLQLEIKQLEEKPAEVLTKIIEKSIETLDIESIPVVEVFFGLGSTEVKETEESKIAQIAQLLAKYPDSKVILTGMADAIGNQNRNLELSLQRAKAVKEILVQKYMLEPTRIKVEAIGSSKSEGETAFDRKVKMKMVKSF